MQCSRADSRLRREGGFRPAIAIDEMIQDELKRFGSDRAVLFPPTMQPKEARIHPQTWQCGAVRCGGVDQDLNSV